MSSTELRVNNKRTRIHDRARRGSHVRDDGYRDGHVHIHGFLDSRNHRQNEPQHQSIHVWNEGLESGSIGLTQSRMPKHTRKAQISENEIKNIRINKCSNQRVSIDTPNGILI